MFYFIRYITLRLKYLLIKIFIGHLLQKCFKCLIKYLYLLRYNAETIYLKQN